MSGRLVFHYRLYVPEASYQEADKAALFQSGGNVSGSEVFEQALNELMRRHYGPEASAEFFDLEPEFEALAEALPGMSAQGAQLYLKSRGFSAAAGAEAVAQFLDKRRRVRGEPEALAEALKAAYFRR